MPESGSRVGLLAANEAKEARQRLCCEACATMKVRCSGGKPSCARCRDRGRQCYYPLAKPGGRPRNASYSPQVNRDIAIAETKPLERLANASTALHCTTKRSDNSTTIPAPSPANSLESQHSVTSYASETVSENFLLANDSGSSTPFLGTLLSPISVPGIPQGKSSYAVPNWLPNLDMFAQDDFSALHHSSQCLLPAVEKTLGAVGPSPPKLLPSNATERQQADSLCLCQRSIISLLKCRTGLQSLAPDTSPAVGGYVATMTELIRASHEKCLSCGNDALVHGIIKSIEQDGPGTSVEDAGWSATATPPDRLVRAEDADAYLGGDQSGAANYASSSAVLDSEAYPFGVFSFSDHAICEPPLDPITMAVDCWDTVWTQDSSH